MTLSLTSSTPADNATDFYVNRNLLLDFNKSISSASLLDIPITLVDIDSGRVVPITISKSTLDASILNIIPKEYLTENTNYKITVIGSDLSLGYYLTAEDGEYLTDSLYISFSTGDNVYKIDTTVEKEAQDLTLEGDLFLPNNVKALGYDFTVDRVRPLNHSINISGNITGDRSVRFKFNKELYSGLSDYSTWVNTTVYPILDTTDYLADSAGLDLGAGSISLPSYSVGISGQYLNVVFNTDLPKNVIVTTSLSDEITSVDNDTYGGELEHIFHTEIYPNIKAVETIKREVRFISVDFTDDFINALLFKNAIWFWEQTGRAFSLSNMNFTARQYVIYATCLDLIEDKDLEKYIVGGSRKRLADIDISYSNILGKMAMKVAKYTKAMQIAKETLFKGRHLKTGVLGVYTEMQDLFNRLWYNANNIYTSSQYKYLQTTDPASNTSINRAAKTNNPWQVL